MKRREVERERTSKLAKSKVFNKGVCVWVCQGRADISDNQIKIQTPCEIHTFSTSIHISFLVYFSVMILTGLILNFKLYPGWFLRFICHPIIYFYHQNFWDLKMQMKYKLQIRTAYFIKTSLLFRNVRILDGDDNLK